MYSLEPPRRGGSNEYPQSMFVQKHEKYQNFLSEIFHFLVVKYSILLYRRVFVMFFFFSFFYEVVLLIRGYTQHAFWPYIDSEINHI